MTLPAIIQWTYSLAIRAKSSVGTVLGTYYAGTLANGMIDTNADGLLDTMVIPTSIGPPTFERIQLDRELYDYSRKPVTVGFIPHLVVSWEQRADEVLGLGAGVNLRAVLSFVTTVGDYLEVSLDGGTTWRACNLVSDSIDYAKIDGKAVGITLGLEFEGQKPLLSVPDASSTSWGTAT